VLPDRPSVNALRAILDQFDIGGRLLHIRDFIWRGGALELNAGTRNTLAVEYALAASWPCAVLERAAEPVGTRLVAARQPVIEGRWVRGSNGYELCVGLDVAVPTAIYIRSQHRLLSHVPFVGRPVWQVEAALNSELTAYTDAFLRHQRPVPEATALDARRLHELALDLAARDVR
jgi:hypothetical protein